MTATIVANLPATVYAKPPSPVVAVYNWTGFYVGGNIGYSWGRSRDNSALTNTAGTVLFANSSSVNLDGIVGGGQIGYNWQVQNWVWGFEADIQGTDEKGSRLFTCPTGVCSPPFGVLEQNPIKLNRILRRGSSWRIRLAEGREASAIAVFEGVDGPGSGFAQVRFELGVGVLDRIEIRRIGRQQQEAGAAGFESTVRTAAPLCAGRLSITTMSPGSRVGTNTCST